MEQIRMYEQLFKPLDDEFDWTVKLAPYLESYIMSLQGQDIDMNFSQAALLLQNAANFYCKRVDILFRIFQKMANDVCSSKHSEGPGDDVNEGNGQTHKKRREKNTKNLESDDFEVIDFMRNDHNIDIDLSSLGKKPLKIVALNSSVKAICKPNTNNTLYDSRNKEMGKKDEFRLQWPVFVDGTVNEDFAFDSEAKISFMNPLDMESLQFLEDSILSRVDDVVDHQNESDMDIEPVMNTLGVPADDEEIYEAPIPSPIAPDPEEPPPEPTVTNELSLNGKRRSPRIIHDWSFFKTGITYPHHTLRPRNVILKKISLHKKKGENVEKDNVLLVGVFHRKVMKGINLIVPQYLKVIGKSQANINSINNLKGSKQKRRAPEPPSNPPLECNDGMGICNESGDLPDVDDSSDREDACFEPEDILPTRITEINSMLGAMSEQHPTEHETGLIVKKMNDEAKKQHALKATEVAKRVAKWHDAIMPALEAAEARSQFNVHEYGSKILSHFPDDDQVNYRPFYDIVQGQPKEEICRYFLSTLMLANTYNLEIRSSGELQKDTLEMKLLSKVRHHEELDDNMREASSKEAPEASSSIRSHSSNGVQAHSSKESRPSPKKKAAKPTKKPKGRSNSCKQKNKKTNSYASTDDEYDDDNDENHDPRGRVSSSDESF